MILEPGCLRGSLRHLSICAVATVVAACSATLPQIADAPPAPQAVGQLGTPREATPGVQSAGTQRPSSAVLPAPSQPATASSAAGANSISQFRSTSIVLFTNETGYDGQRVSVSSLPLPLPVGRRSADGTRLEIMTVAGARWLSVADTLAEAKPADRTLAAGRR